ncbi:MAG: FecR domain-containing protein [Deltaproteobacteria bacterium]|nr:FecR domain-containing protein [Deltaproteobacteria bacterium]
MRRRLALCGLIVVVGCHAAEDQTPISAVPPPDVAAAVSAPPVAVLPAWRFIEVDGAVSIDGAPAARDQVIKPTSTIDVGAESSALITLGAKSIIEVREKTKLTLGASPRKKISAHLRAGQLWNFFGGATDYEVVTDNAVAGVRGTVFYVNAEDPKVTLVCACSRGVHLESLDPKKPSSHLVEAKEWEHIGTAFVRKGKQVGKKKMGKIADPPNHPNARGKELLARMPE